MAKHLSCKCECKYHSKKCNLNQKWNNKCPCECKNPEEHRVYKKGYFSNPAKCSCNNGKDIGSIIADSVVICDEIIDTTETIPTERTSIKFILTKSTSTNVHIFLAFLFIDYHSIIDSCYYLPYKALIKTETYIIKSRHQQVKRN